MNDTLHLWNDVWQCAEKKDRVRDSAFVVWTFVVLVIVTVLFYASSYIQGGGAVRNLINCKSFSTFHHYLTSFPFRFSNEST